MSRHSQNIFSLFTNTNIHSPCYKRTHTSSLSDLFIYLVGLFLSTPMNFQYRLSFFTSLRCIAAFPPSPWPFIVFVFIFSLHLRTINAWLIWFIKPDKLGFCWRISFQQSFSLKFSIGLHNQIMIFLLENIFFIRILSDWHFS